MMSLREFANSIRILWNIERDDYLACINPEDRQFLGDALLWDRFKRDPFRAFVSLPDQDQERVFALIVERNMKAGIK